MEVFKRVIKNRKPHIKINDIKKQSLKKYKLGKNHKRENILKKARKRAHSILADTRRDVSNRLRD